jgi:hypothetical protein
MSRPPRLARYLVIGLAAALLRLGGCSGRTACFTVTASDLGPDQTCPDVAVATTRLVNNTCGGSIESIDGAGSLDGDLCCYPVTYFGSNSDDGDIDCEISPGGSFGGSSGIASSASSGISGFGGSTTTSCATCNQALGGAPFDQACNPAVLSAVTTCGCSTACASACQATLCTGSGNAPDNGCLSCLQASCLSQLQSCQAQ